MNFFLNAIHIPVIINLKLEQIASSKKILIRHGQQKTFQFQTGKTVRIIH